MRPDKGHLGATKPALGTVPLGRGDAKRSGPTTADAANAEVAGAIFRCGRAGASCMSPRSPGALYCEQMTVTKIGTVHQSDGLDARPLRF